MHAPLIALELHDTSLWDPSRVLPVLPVMRDWGYNALVLHQNDLLDVCTQLGRAENFGVADLRLKKVRNATAWLNRLVHDLSQFNARLFLEIKEPSFHDYALEAFPGLVGENGLPDPAATDWPDFCQRKVEDLLERVPGIGGLVVNLSSPESRVSLPDHIAATGACLDLVAWFDAMISAFHRPLSQKGKTLWVRDFSYTTDLQSDVMAAVDRQGGTVGASVKITAHDYFPEYPENPVARRVSAPIMLEFEAFGEHTGWGVIPNCRVAELQRRMAGYRQMDAAGLLVRISWEAIVGATALDTLSAVNVFALPKLVGQDTDAKVLVKDWLIATHNLADPLAQEVTDLLLQSWTIPAASYWNARVFPRHSCLPSTWQEGWLSMQTDGMGRRGHGVRIDPNEPLISDAARPHLFSEKEAATTLAKTLAQRAEQLRPNLPPQLSQLFAAFAHLPRFALQFELAIKATFLAARDRDDEKSELAEIKQALLNLSQAKQPSFDLPHHAVLFDPDQIVRFARSLPV